MGGLHYIIDLESPWQNGKVERHGGVVKSAIRKALGNVDCQSLSDFDILVDGVVAAKKRFYNRGGFRPPS